MFAKVSSASAALTSDGTSDGYATILSNTSFYPGGKCWLAQYVAASLDLSTKTTHINTVIKSKLLGTSGNAVSVEFVNNPGLLQPIEIVETIATAHALVYYRSTVSTVTNFEGAITNGVKAVLQGSTLGSGNFDTIIEAASYGAAGNDIMFVLIGDSGGGVTVDEVGTTVTLHFEDGISTVSDVETAIGTTTLIRVRTTGTGATVLDNGTDSGSSGLGSGHNASTLLAVKTAGTGGHVFVSPADSFTTTSLSGGTDDIKSCTITDLSGSTKVGLRFEANAGTAGPNYGRSDLSAYLTSKNATIYMPAQSLMVNKKFVKKKLL